jgi:ATP-binding cassette subfamily B protein/ATP-binding cassette subfamily C protein
MIKSLVTLVSQIIIVIGLVAVISTLNVLIILLIVLIVLLNSLIFKKTQEMEFKISEELIPINRKFQYYAQTTSDFSLGKDMRLYDIAPLMMDKIIRYNKESIALFKEMSSSNGRYSGLTEINVQFQMIAVYGYMAYKVLSHSIGIGDFTMYINSAIGFSNSISKSIDNFIQFRQMCRYLGPYLEFEKIKSANTLGGRKVEVSQRYSIEFRNVYFKYPKSNDYTLKNVSINIHDGEKLSIVGLNGAGKTTFIKLLTRLYEPTRGEILLNGVNIKEYDYSEYMKLLSVVFQDFKLMAFSVKENIALENSEQLEDSKILDTLKKSGLDNDISKLERGIHTPVYKTFEKEGIEFSGGQSQKLVISRAIFKDSPIVILDEPTAALHPIAEYDIYSKFNELIGDKTTIYISHRLSSCRFCDKIAVFHNGEIVQYGTHDELIAQNGSQYETMYMAQAQYYV